MSTVTTPRDWMFCLPRCFLGFAPIVLVHFDYKTLEMLVGWYHNNLVWTMMSGLDSRFLNFPIIDAGHLCLFGGDMFR